MSFRELGYLSPDSVTWIAQIREANRDWFEHTDKLNRLGQRAAFLASADDESNREFVSILLFLRALFHFQGVVLLAERGMSIEARSLARGALEAAFCLKALVADEKFLDQLVSADTHHRKVVASALISPSHRQYLDPTNASRLETFLAELHASSSKTASMKIEQIARMGGHHEIYQTIYRALSGDASHVSVASLSHYVKEMEAGDAIAVGPVVSTAAIAETLQAASLALHACLDGLTSLLGLSALEAEIAPLRGDYNSLTKRMAQQSAEI